MDFAGIFAFSAMALGLLFLVTGFHHIRDIRKYNDGFCPECKVGEFVFDGEMKVEEEGEGKTGLFEYHCSNCEHTIRTRSKM